MRYFIIAGEASGDLHGGNLIKEIRKFDSEAHFMGLGGDIMRNNGCTLVQHYNKMAYMGILAVISNISHIQHNLSITKRSLIDNQPDILILIDYPTFNLHIAEYSKKNLPNTKIVYYIPPKVWAWKTWRIHKLAKLSDLILGIFPFEPEFYAHYGYKCTYVGNPTNYSIRQWKENNNIEDTSIQQNTINIALLPGSRENEIKKCLPKMIKAAENVKHRIEKTEKKITISIAVAPGTDERLYTRYASTAILTKNTYQLLDRATAAVVNSGTATLETALIGCPQTAVYYVTGGKFLWWLKPIIFKIRHFTPVNIISGKETIRELIAQHFTQAEIEQELMRLITDYEYREQIKKNYHIISSLLGDMNAAETAARMIVKLHK